MNNKNKTIYCHFSCRRPKNERFGYFSVAFFKDYDGNDLIGHVTRKYDLWEDQAFITSIQSYEHALMTIYELQGVLRKNNINQVMLVTNNGTLAAWIEDPKKNKIYRDYMERAVKPYRAGSFKEIVLGVGLCYPRNKEKAHKYCEEKYVDNEYIPSEIKRGSDGYKIDIGEYKSIMDIIDDEESSNEVVANES